MAVLKLHQQIHIAVRASGAFQPRPKQRETADMVAATQSIQGGGIGEKVVGHRSLSISGIDSAANRWPTKLRGRATLFKGEVISAQAEGQHQPAHRQAVEAERQRSEEHTSELQSH